MKLPRVSSRSRIASVRRIRYFSRLEQLCFGHWEASGPSSESPPRCPRISPSSSSTVRWMVFPAFWIRDFTEVGLQWMPSLRPYPATPRGNRGNRGVEPCAPAPTGYWRISGRLTSTTKMFLEYIDVRLFRQGEGEPLSIPRRGAERCNRGHPFILSSRR